MMGRGHYSQKLKDGKGDGRTLIGSEISFLFSHKHCTSGGELWLS